MNNFEIIEKINSTEFEDEDEDIYSVEILPGLSEAEIKELQKHFPDQKINEELKGILKITRGLDSGRIEGVIFDSINAFGFESLIPNSICLGMDGFGNHWVLDLKSNGKLGNIYFVCHDPPVIVIQANTLNEYLNQLLEFHLNPVENTINLIHDEKSFKVWESKTAMKTLGEFLEENPSLIKPLNNYEKDQWQVSDLRNKGIGNGFPWAINGPQTNLVRVEDQDIWLLEKRKQESFWKRLFG